MPPYSPFLGKKNREKKTFQSLQPTPPPRLPYVSTLPEKKKTKKKNFFQRGVLHLNVELPYRGGELRG